MYSNVLASMHRKQELCIKQIVLINYSLQSEVCTSFCLLSNESVNIITIQYIFRYVDGVMHFFYSHKYNINSTEGSSDMN